MRKILLTTLFFLHGCATIYPECEGYTEGSEDFEECQTYVREYRRGIDYENWIQCRQLYEQAGVATVCRDHTEKDHKPGHWAVEQDLWQWSCRFHLREYWADY